MPLIIDPIPAATNELANARPLTLRLQPIEQAILLSHLQLALRHPLNTGPSAQVARRIAKRIQANLSRAGPNLRFTTEAGWNPQFDVDHQP